MTFWKFLDENLFGIALLVFALGTCGPRVACGIREGGPYLQVGGALSLDVTRGDGGAL